MDWVYYAHYNPLRDLMDTIRSHFSFMGKCGLEENDIAWLAVALLNGQIPFLTTPIGRIEVI
jgi:hypothetical protein